MKFNEILQSEETNIILAFSPLQLKEFAHFVIKEYSESIGKKPEKDEYLSKEEVKKLLNVSDTTLWHWKKNKYLIPSKVGRKSVYKNSDVEAILSGN